MFFLLSTGNGKWESSCTETVINCFAKGTAIVIIYFQKTNRKSRKYKTYGVEDNNILGTQWKKLHTNQTVLVPLANFDSF